MQDKNRLFIMNIRIKSYVTESDLVAIHKSKVILKLKKPAYVRMWILKLSQVLIYKLHNDCIKSNDGSNSRLLFTYTDSLMYEIQTKYVYEDHNMDKEMFNFSNNLAKSKYYDDSKNKLLNDERWNW